MSLHNRIWPVIGLTGGMASGKSTVTKLLQQAGAYIIDADHLAHAVIKKSGPAYAAVVDGFGRDILDTEGEIDRKRLGDFVFSNHEERERLNQCVHPHVFARFETEWQVQVKTSPETPIIFDAALLIETGAYRYVRKVVVVYVDIETQIARLMHRDGLTPAEARQRIDAQMPLSEKIRFADEIIDNRLPQAEIEKIVLALYRRCVLTVSRDSPF